MRIVVDPPYFETFMFESFSVPFRDANDRAISEEERERDIIIIIIIIITQVIQIMSHSDVH